MEEDASKVDSPTAGRFMEAAAAAGFSAADILIMTHNRAVMEGFRLWCEQQKPDFFAPKTYQPCKEELRRLLRTPACEIFTSEAICKHGGRRTSIDIKVSLLMGRGAPIINGREWLDGAESNNFLQSHVRYLCVLTHGQALVYPGMGLKAIGIIERILADSGLSLGMDPSVCT